MQDSSTTSADAWRPRGIVPPLVTPLNDVDTLDRPGTMRLLDHVIESGVSGVFILGTTGEAPSLSYRLRRQLIELVCQHVAERVPVLVGVTDTSFIETIQMANVAAEAGATAVVLSTPYYFPAGQTELSRYIGHVVKQTPLPLVLYNMPSLTKVWFEIDTLARLSEHDEIIGIKDSSGALGYFRQLIQLKNQRPDWTVMIGPEHLLAEALAIGADGGVCGGANIFPQLFVRLYRTMRGQSTPPQQAEVDALIHQINKLQQIYDVGKYASRFIKATKSALSLRGICSDRMAEPFNHFLPPERARVKAILDELVASMD